MKKENNSYIFLDTNIHLHFRGFDEIGWDELINSPKITIVFTHRLLKELEKKKVERAGDSIGKRAKSAISKISKLIDEEIKEIRQGTFVEFFVEPITQVQFSIYHLNENISDDCILAELLFFKEKRNKAKVCLFTTDLGLKARAKYLGIKVYELPQKFQLPPVVDEQKKEIQKLKKELNEIKLIKPNLILNFLNNDNKTRYFLKAPNILPSLANAIRLNDIKLKFPRLDVPEVASNLSEEAVKEKLEKLKHKDNASAENLAELLLIFGDSLQQIPVFEYERYNSELDQFYNYYWNYLEELDRVKEVQNLMLVCSVNLSNNGTGIAEDIDIELEFPSGIKFIYVEEIPSRPLEPNSPELPRPLIVIVGKLIVNGIRRLFSREPINEINQLPEMTVNQAYPERFVFSENRQKAFVKIGELKHYYSKSLPKIYMFVDSFSEARSFEINCHILPKNLPHPINGKLHIIIEKEIPLLPMLRLDF